MKLKIYKENDIENKLRTRKLYEECFPNDSERLVDYYYSVLIKRNIILTLEYDYIVISMIHLNPYLYSICGEETNIHYLFAIATKQEYRYRGFMKSLINEAITYLQDFKEPFCYLAPECPELEKFYNKYGFYKICNFTFDKFSKDQYDIFPIRNDEFNDMMKEEQSFLDEDPIDYLDGLKNRIVLGKPLRDDISLDFLKSKRICICNEV